MTIKYTWIGHGTHNLEVDGKQILVDPFFVDNPTTDVSPASVDADYILVSHGHGDHVADLISIAKRTGATIIANAEISGWLKSTQGIPAKQVHAQHIGGGYQHEFGYLKFTIAHHGSGLPDGSYGGNPAGFLLNTLGKKIYLACDTGLFSDMKLYGDEGIDLLFCPLAITLLWGRMMPCRRLNW